MKDDVQDLSAEEAGVPSDGSVWILMRLNMKTNKMEVNIRQPNSEADTQVLMKEVARLPALVADCLASSPHGACHAGCAFAAIIEQAHKDFHKQEPDEYHRVVDQGMLTKAVGTSHGH